MELSLFLAQIIGIFYIVIAGALIFRKDMFSKMIESIERESLALIVMAMISVIAGLAIIITHNVWEASWRVVPTIIGWGALVKGVAYLWFPEKMFRLAGWLEGRVCMRAAIYLSVLLGVWMVYVGFFT